MSKSLRMLLLSMLVIAVAAMPAMAASSITFYWTGVAENNSWGDPSNWSADVVYNSSTHGDANNYYPGKIAASVASVDVVISNDADIYLDQQNGNGFTTGALSNIRGISIDAKVSIDLGAYGYFVNVPNIKVSGDLKLTGTRTLTIDSTPTWSSNGAMVLGLPVAFGEGKSLTLSIDNAPLTINDASLLNRTTVKVSGSGNSNNKGKLILAVSPNAAANGRQLTVNLTNGAELNTPNDVTLYANWDTTTADNKPVISCDTFTKTGSGVLTFTRTNITSYDTPISSKVNTINVNAGSIVFGSRRIAASSLDINVAADAKLDVNAARAIETSKDVRLVVSGDAEIATAGIGTATSVYTGSVLTLTPFNVSADVRSTGTLTFKGTQPVKGLKGTGTVTVSGDSSILIIDAESADINGFTGTLNATNVGLAKSFDNLPFSKASADIASFYVYGQAALTLDAAKLADVEGMDATTIFLRSNYYGTNGAGVTETALTSSYVGSLLVSGEVTLGTVRVDGAKTHPAVITFTSADDVLTVNSVVLHANKDQDASTPTYSAVNALVISGDGTFVPKAMSNATSSSGLGSNRSITVRDNATLKLDIDIPAYNSLMLNGGKLNAANGVSIPGDFTIQSSDKGNYVKVAITSDNGSGLFASGHNALNVGGNFNLTGTISIDMTLDDEGKFLGKMYKLVGPAGTDFSKVTSKDVNLIPVGTYSDVMLVSYDIKGINGILDKLIQLPRLGEGWTITEGASTFGSGENEFVAKLSYDMPVNVTPASLLNLLNISVDIAGQVFSNNGTTRQLVTKNGANMVYIASLELNSTDREIVLTGTSYVPELDTKIALNWSKESPDWAPYEKAGMYYGSRKLQSQDFRDLDWVELTISNPTNPSDPSDVEDGMLSQDVTADPEEIVIEAETPEITAGSGDVVLTIDGIREAVAANTSAKPVLVGEVYVWMHGFDNTTKYEMLYNDNWILMESLDIRIDGVSVNSASVDIEGGSDSITVTIPAALFNTETTVPIFQNVTIVGFNNGHTLTAGPASVHVVPDYEERPVDEGMGALTYTQKDLPKSPIIVNGISDFTGPFSFDLTVNGVPETPSWFTWNVNSADGTIAYDVAEGADAGTYNMRVLAYTAEGGYIYNFTLTINEGLKINDAEFRFDSTYGGLNYEAYFTTNAPAGTMVDWDLPSESLPEALKGFKFTKSGDTFVVYGQLPPYDDSDAEGANEYTYTVTATISGDTLTKEETITVEEDTDEVVDHTGFTAGGISFPDGKDIISADSTYSVDITFNADYYDTEIEFLSFPYWLVATPKVETIDGEEVITGYTITYKTGAGVTAGDTGVVRFEDPDSGNIISWPVTFNETIAPEPGPGPAPQSEDLKLTTASSVSLTLGTATGATSTLALEAENAIGTVSYTSTVSPDNGGLTVSISGSRATLTGSTAGTYTVIFTATDDGRAAPNNTATFTTTVTVAGGVLPPTTSRDLTLGVSASSVSMNLGTQGGNTRTVTLTTTNASGDVTYTSAVTPASGLTVAISGDVATLTATTAGTYTVTFTATDAAGRTATAVTTVTVTSGVTPPTPGGSEDVGQFSVTASRSVLTVAPGDTATFTLSHNALGEVSYSVNQTWAEIDDNTVTITAPETEGSYSVTITATDSGRSTDSNTASVTVTVIVDEDLVRSLGSSSGGCDAGFGALALALALPLFLRRRRS